MPINETKITLVGNMVDEVELRYTPDGTPVGKCRVASTERRYDKSAGEWRDGATIFLTCTLWRKLAENAAESLTAGTPVIVHGRLHQRSYETKEGQKRTVYELEADEIGVSLRRGTATYRKAARSNAAAETGAADDPWLKPAPSFASSTASSAASSAASPTPSAAAAGYADPGF